MPVLETQFLFLQVTAGQPHARVGQDNAVRGPRFQFDLEEHPVPLRGLAERLFVVGGVDQGDGDELSGAEGAPADADLGTSVEHGDVVPVGSERVGLFRQRDAFPAAAPLTGGGESLVAGSRAADVDGRGVGVEAEAERGRQPGVGLGHGVRRGRRVLGAALRAGAIELLRCEVQLPLQVGLLRIQRAHEVLAVGRRFEQLVFPGGRTDEPAVQVGDEFLSGVHGGAPEAV